MYELFEKEKVIMEIFWRLNKPCLISEILRDDPTLSRNTVAKALVNLEKKGYLKVDSIRRTATRTGRAYVPVISKEEYELQEAHLQTVSSNITLPESALALFSTLIKADRVEDEFIDELEKMIADYKNRKE